MTNKEAQEVIKQILPVGYPQTDEALAVIAKSIIHGYRLCKVDELLAEVREYRADCDLTADDRCRKCNELCFGSIERMIEGACE